MQKGKKIFVGLSGGVDSSVSAHLLKKAGHDVTGVFIKVWQPEFLNCNWEKERLDAMRVAAHLDIPFLTCNAEEEYREHVAQYFIDEYKAGRTPNPDVLCNAEIKFKVFKKFADSHGADGIATGHYAQVKMNDDKTELHKGVDGSKDQTYFLWAVEKEVFESVLFPIGHLEKNEVRKIAEKVGLPTATKDESQGICFLGHVDIEEFISHYTELKGGDVLDENGNVVGTHNGALIYTIGQRHGFLMNTSETDTKAHYVIKKDIDKNTITVSSKQPTLERGQIKLTGVNMLSDELKEDALISVQNRYRQNEACAKVLSMQDGEMALGIQEKIELPAIGQSCVMYKDSLCLGGGIIQAVS